MNPCFAVSLSLSSSFFFFFVRIFSTEAAPVYLHHDCPNTDLFTPNSTYRANLDALLSSLSSAATNSTHGFANATAGQNPPDRAFGLFLCRGDLNIATCSDCLATGKQEILQRCPNQRVSVIWYAECMLRYSNRSIFSVMEESPAITMNHTGNITDPARFTQVLGKSIRDVAYRASGSVSGKKFADSEMNFTSLQKLHAMAQCTPDLMERECNVCLLSAIDILEGKQGGSTFTPSCNVRYELDRFYNDNPVPAPFPPPVGGYEGPPPPPVARYDSPPAPPPVPTPAGSNNKVIVITISITVPGGGVAITLAIALVIRRIRKNRTYGS